MRWGREHALRAVPEVQGYGQISQLEFTGHYRSAASHYSGETSFRTKRERLGTNNTSKHVSCIKETYKNEAQADPSLPRKELSAPLFSQQRKGRNSLRWDHTPPSADLRMLTAHPELLSLPLSGRLKLPPFGPRGAEHTTRE